jgi:hypothetical protein
MDFSPFVRGIMCRGDARARVEVLSLADDLTAWPEY